MQYEIPQQPLSSNNRKYNSVPLIPFSIANTPKQVFYVFSAKTEWVPHLTLAVRLSVKEKEETF